MSDVDERTCPACRYPLARYGCVDVEQDVEQVGAFCRGPVPPKPGVRERNCFLCKDPSDPEHPLQTKHDLYPLCRRCAGSPGVAERCLALGPPWEEGERAKRKGQKTRAVNQARIREAVLVKSKSFDPLTTNRHRESLGGDIHKDTVTNSRSLHDRDVTGQKPWDKCRRFMCQYPTESGKPEKDPAKRVCRYHAPEVIAARKEEMEKGLAKRRPCIIGPLRSCFSAPGRVHGSTPRPSFGSCASASGTCTTRHLCQTEAEWYYEHWWTPLTCRFTAARWKRKTVPWKYGDPSPPGLYDEDEEDG